jgi:transcriptional regulator with XRE-family HTH domain
MDRPALADFLRRHRDALQPAEVGLPVGQRRRTSGLRREEVAALAAMSVDYYARLEQQRGPQPSEQMVAALARALRLTLDERDHLFRLTGHTAPTRVLRSDHVPPALLRVLDRLSDSPAFVVSDLGETLVQNRLAVALLGDHSGYTGSERSQVFRWFTDPDERRRYPVRDHDHQSHLQTAALRAALGAAGRGSRAAQLAEELSRRSAEFARIWDLHEVRRRFDDHKTLVHPELGEIDLDCQALVTEDQSQALVVLTAQRGTEAYQKLELLAVIGEQSFASS